MLLTELNKVCSRISAGEPGHFRKLAGRKAPFSFQGLNQTFESGELSTDGLFQFAPSYNCFKMEEG